MKRLKHDIRFLAIIVIAVIAVIVESTVYIIGFIEHGVFMAALVWLAWGFMKENKE